MQDIPGLQFRRGGPLPLHSQIAEAFRKAIQEGRLKPGDRLPSEPELVTQLGVSRATIRQAMAELLAEGLIYRYQGRGTFVAPQKLEHPLQRLISFSEDIRSRGMQPGSKLLFFGLVNTDAEIAAYLQIPPGKTVLRIYRLRLADNRPVGLHDSYIPYLHITSSELEETGSLYALLESKGIVLAEAEETIEAVAATPEQGQLLNLPRGAPLLLVSRVVYTIDHTPIEFVRAYYHPNLYRYSIKLKR
jgi:GntR family transcriptional regulator